MLSLFAVEVHAACVVIVFARHLYFLGEGSTEPDVNLCESKQFSD